MIEKGLNAKGFNYVLIESCWQVKIDQYRAKEINQGLEMECQNLDKINEKLKDDNRSLQREIADIQRTHKADMNKIVHELDNMRVNFRVEEPSEKLTAELREAEQ